MRKLVRGAALVLLAVVACRQVDPSGGAIDRAFGGTPRDAVRSFYSSGIDSLVVGNFLIQK